MSDMALDELNALYQELGRDLVADAPQGWEEIRAVYLEVGKTAGMHALAVMQDGSETYLHGLGFPISDAFEALRRRLYQPGKGAWYTAAVTVTSSGSISFDFDYENEPQWDIDVVPLTYVEDLEMFPRDEQHRPAWLREKLRLAGV